jgi:hypothetical protein
MAYSRWGKDSVWYTFWTATLSEPIQFRLPTKKRKDNQYFEICDMPSYYVSYGELKQKGIKQVVKEIQAVYQKTNFPFSEYTKLRWQLVRFMDDIDEHFEWKNFFLYEWWYPIRNRIYFMWRDLFKK